MSRTKNVFHHCVEVIDVGIGGVEAHQRFQRVGITLLAVIGRIEQFAVQVAVDDACRKLGNLSHIGSERFPARLLRQPLRNGDDRHQDGGSRKARNDESARVEAPVRRRRPVGVGFLRQGKSYSVASGSQL